MRRSLPSATRSRGDARAIRDQMSCHGLRGARGQRGARLENLAAIGAPGHWKTYWFSETALKGASRWTAARGEKAVAFRRTFEVVDERTPNFINSPSRLKIRHKAKN